MLLFKKRIRIEDIPTDGPWSILQGQMQGMPMIVRFNTAFINLKPIQTYESFVIVRIFVVAPTQDGFPPSEEMDALDTIEEKFSEALEKDKSCLPAFVLTTKGTRDLCYYTANLSRAESLLEEVQQTVFTHRLEFLNQQDPEWSVYAHFGRSITTH